MKLQLNVALVAAAGGLCLASTASAQTLVQRVRAATQRFADVATAEAEGYAPVACASGTGGGAMGIHYVNVEYLTGDENMLDISKPEAVMYEPRPRREPCSGRRGIHHLCRSCLA